MLWSQAPVDNQAHKNAFMQPLEPRLQNILKTKSVLYERAFLGSGQLGGRRHERPRSVGRANSACLRSQDPGLTDTSPTQPRELSRSPGHLTTFHAERQRTSPFAGAPSGPWVKAGSPTVSWVASSRPQPPVPTTWVPRTGDLPVSLPALPVAPSITPGVKWGHNLLAEWVNRFLQLNSNACI